MTKFFLEGLGSASAVVLKNRKFTYQVALLVFLMANALFLLPPLAAIPSTITWIDDFDSPILNGRWSWIREEETHWSLSERPGFMRIMAQTGSIVGASPNDQKNMLLTRAPVGNFVIETKLTITPTADYQKAGLLIYQDDDKFISLSRSHDYGENLIEYYYEEPAGEGGTGGTRTWGIESATSLYLRIEKYEDAYTSSYSTDGSTWIYWSEGGTYNVDLNNAEIGIDASKSGPSANLPEFPVDFDYFKLVDNSYYLFLPVTISK